MRFGLTGGVTERRQRHGGGGHVALARVQGLWVGEHRELVRETGVPGLETRGVGIGQIRRIGPIRLGDPTQLVQRPRGVGHVAGGEQCLAPERRELGASGGAGGEQVESPAEQVRLRQEFVARQGAAAGRPQADGGALPEGAPALVERSELEQVLVRVLEVQANSLVVLDDAALGRAQPFEASSQQHVNRRRHVEHRHLDGRLPALARAHEDSVLQQHAHQLAEEERIAVAGGEHAADERGGQLRGADDTRPEPHRGGGVEATECDHLGNQAPRRRQRGALGPIAGGRLAGTAATSPPVDWSFAEDHALAQIETRPPRPHSVNVRFAVADARLYLDLGRRGWAFAGSVLG